MLVKAVHLKIKDNVCPHCDYKDADKDNRNIHIKAVHPNTKSSFKDNVCPHCDYKDADKDNRNIHIKAVHPNTKSFTCHDSNGYG